MHGCECKILWTQISATLVPAEYRQWVHKSHIKKGHKSCEIATHFKSLANSTHKLDTTNQETFTSQLKEHLKICIIESVVPVPGIDIKATLKEREDFWQATLKSTTFFGGINKRSNRT